MHSNILRPLRTRDNKKEALVKQKAIEIIVKQGIDGFSMNKLARECEISVATLYIYYSDKEDLIKKIGVSIGKEFFSAMLKDFCGDMHFVEGLKKQWDNRAKFMINNTFKIACWEALQSSAHSDYLLKESMKDFRIVMMDFFHKAIERKEMLPMPKDVFWSIAYGPLYSLLRFHEKGKGIGGTPFKLTKEIQNQTFDLVIKALTP